MHSNIFDNLNEQQAEAVRHAEGPSIILAGAGSGKTRVLTMKVLYLIKDKGIDPSHIIMMTFTNKAAGEMTKRVGFTLGFIGTFHSFCAAALRRYGRHVGLNSNFLIYDEDDTESLLKNIIKDVNSPKKITPSYVKHKISSAKDNLIEPSEYIKFSDTQQDEIIAKIYLEYQKRLEKNNAVDFDDLIFKGVALFRDNPSVLKKYNDMFRYILVDEFQDTNAGQYMLARYLARGNNNITVVGDFSQSIYSWRGADIKNLERFQRDFKGAKVFYLQENYRSTQNVLDFAYNIINHNETHPILELFTKNDQGDDVLIQELENEEAEGVFVAEEITRLMQKAKLSEVAVLYRINAQSRAIEEVFLHYGIPYVLIGGTRFYERKEIKDLLSYIRLIVNPSDEISLERVHKIGKKRFEQFKVFFKEIKNEKDQYTTDELIKMTLDSTGYFLLYDENDPQDFARLENIKELRSVAVRFPNVHEFLQQVALVESEYSESEKSKKNKNGVRMMTLHQAKGLEFPYVFIIGVEEGLLPHSRSLYDLHELEEERRLLYVGITRAEKKLYLTHAQRRFMFGRRMYSQVSRFIDKNDNGEDTYIKTF
ncbi:hypothetical protein A3H80_02660 [Candidatus Roizmanbacteria bacterium RIFCSPLOWO2_02_FULL_37_19]|nr:MAG: hypothetical protein A2862_00915 [Candidatus Roizmanbacteria bacterium RIFCSPHIGHO2_01_FULL_38_41]OGK32094.1 MAG: hypothetical protein A3E10_00435 [Candidatus Roizmanbacteria bacterium RIFCSPHIGHO2_12_FULL_37_23]OGK44939.1 MAG: hypothetical protein A2956_05025 [Candidatus Roizmanbacteria bacterium RIFCSPLOWO2_01_FULL_37_57]OGK53762.1 MAG: hypothetical protein A3H80_02660 [Candidatus Roizmanbacteria bacterium RIFCSPLOWO2_02_FULL_37_19]